MPASLYTCPMPVHAHVVSDEASRCPECGMKLVPTAAVPHWKEAEAQWHKDHQTTDTQATEGSGATLYTCPMASHAHIVSDQAGRCPECNMKLVPTGEVEHGKQAEEAWLEKTGHFATTQ